MARVVWFLVVMLLSPLLAGCLGEDNGPLRPFTSLEAPPWEAGFTWAWDASQAERWSYASGEGQGSSTGETTQRIEQRVLNTEVPFYGERVYWLRANEDVDLDTPGTTGVFGTSGLQAVGQDDLQPVARFHEHRMLVDGCEESGLSGIRLDPFPLLRFPLEQGAQWEQELQEHLTMRAEVRGATDVRVPAGTFEAVEVGVWIDVDPAFFEADRGGGGEELRSFSSSMRVWYAHEVRNVVRLESHTEWHIVEEEGEAVMSADTSLALASFSLVAEVEEALPPIMDVLYPRADADAQQPFPELGIVSDASFPLNAANESLEVSFGLAPRDGPMDAARGIGHVAEVPTELPWFDAENETVVWSIASQEHQIAAQGHAVRVTLPPGGGFEVSARLLPRWIAEPKEEPSCGATTGEVSGPLPFSVPPRAAYGTRLAQGGFSVEWHKAFEVRHEGTSGADHPLFEVPMAHGALVQVSYDVRHSGSFRDEVAFVLETAGGDVRLEPGEERSFWDGGNATALWQARSGGLLRPTGVTFGHAAAGWVHVRY